ncbi:MAG TPA: FGGY family carbohydrate kinase [Acidimicrobiales bacterium]|nr:FGGY family carbohydrate kinase [Acidimicrobiales bacterium]
MNSELCLSIDLGTGGPKVGLVSLDGEILATEVHAVTTHFGSDGAATQDAKEWWTIILAASRRLLDGVADSRTNVRAVAVTGQYASTVPVDANGTPTGPCITWLDVRGGRYTQDAVGGWFLGYNPRKVLPFVRKTGGAPSTAGADPIGQIHFITREMPEVAHATRWYMEPIDYLTMRFSGVASATHASRLAMWMTDNRHLDEYRYDTGLLSLVGLDEKYLPPLQPFGSVVATLSESVASHLGLSRDVVVVSAVPDLHAAALGAAATSLYETHLALSTTSWISCPVPTKKTDINHNIAAVPGLSNDSYVLIDNQETGAKALEWLRGVMAGSGVAPTYDELDELAATSPSGSNGVRFSPWLAGERSPISNKHIRAGLSNLSLTTTSADVVRAVMEGVAANSAWLFGYVEKLAGQTLSPVRLVGGGAQSALWCQIFADSLDREVQQIDQPLVAQLRGAALLAGCALGQYSLHDVPVPKSTTFAPSPGTGSGSRDRVDELKALYERDKKWSRGRQRAT